MTKLLKEFKEWELHHKVLAFNIFLIGTIIAMRAGVYCYNPSPVIMNFELHHFDYGMILLFITCLLLIIHKRNSPLYLIMAAVAFGLIIDELWFVRGTFNRLPNTNDELYNSTLLSSFIIAKVITVVSLLIYHFRKKKVPQK